jgi:hypothetical protein
VGRSWDGGGAAGLPYRSQLQQQQQQQGWLMGIDEAMDKPAAAPQLPQGSPARRLLSLQRSASLGGAVAGRAAAFSLRSASMNGRLAPSMCGPISELSSSCSSFQSFAAGAGQDTRHCFEQGSTSTTSDSVRSLSRMSSTGSERSSPFATTSRPSFCRVDSLASDRSSSSFSGSHALGGMQQQQWQQQQEQQQWQQQEQQERQEQQQQQWQMEQQQQQQQQQQGLEHPPCSCYPALAPAHQEPAGQVAPLLPAFDGVPELASSEGAPFELAPLLQPCAGGSRQLWAAHESGQQQELATQLGIGAPQGALAAA